MNAYLRFDAKTLNLAFHAVLDEHGAMWRETLTGQKHWAALTAAAAVAREAATSAPAQRSFSQSTLAAIHAQDAAAGLLRATLLAVASDPAAPATLVEAGRRVEAGLEPATLSRGRRIEDRVARADRAARALAEDEALRTALSTLRTATGTPCLAVVERFIALGRDILARHEARSSVGGRLREQSGRRALADARATLLAARASLAAETGLRADLPAGLFATVFATPDAAAERLRRSSRRAAVAADPVEDAADPVEDAENEPAVRAA
jgi:hypothetical protein